MLKCTRILNKIVNSTKKSSNLNFLRIIHAYTCKMNNDEDLEKLSRGELIRRVRTLEHKCNVLETRANNISTSKYAQMQRKVLRSDKRKKKKVIDFTRTRMVALKVAYFGWDLEGFQDNPGLEDSVEKLMIQGLVRAKLIPKDFEHADLNYTKCGRTDKEVSAFEQVMSFKLRSILKPREEIDKNNINDLKNSIETNENGVCENKINDDESYELNHHVDENMDITENKDSKEKSDIYSLEYELNYPKMLNSVLPPEIRVLAWSPISKSFNARFDCTKRVYRYVFPKGQLSIDKMNEAAKYYQGELQDFRNFCKLNPRDRVNHVRYIHQFQIEKLDENENKDSQYSMYFAEIIGTGFLYHQVRYMMNVLFLVGLKKEEPTIVKRLLDLTEFPRRPQYDLTAGYPLALYQVSIPNLKWMVSPYCYDSIMYNLHDQWCKLSIKAAQTKMVINKFKEDSKTELIGSDLQEGHSKFKSHVGISLINEAITDNYKKLEDRQCCLSLKEAIDKLERKIKERGLVEDFPVASDHEGDENFETESKKPKTLLKSEMVQS